MSVCGGMSSPAVRRRFNCVAASAAGARRTRTDANELLDSSSSETLSPAQSMWIEAVNADPSSVRLVPNDPHIAGFPQLELGGLLSEIDQACLEHNGGE